MRIFLAGILLLSLAGCNRTGTVGTSSLIRIQVPKSLSGFAKAGEVSAMESLPSGRNVCWGATIEAPDLGQLSTGDACDIKAGLTLGFVQAGGTLEASVPRGTGRLVTLFAFIQPSGTNQPCPNFTVSLPKDVLVNTYAMGSALSVDMSGNETKVEITASFPGLANNVASTAAMPAVCTAVNVVRGVPLNGQISSGANIVVQNTTGYKLKARIGQAVQPGQAVSSQTGYKLLVK